MQGNQVDQPDCTDKLIWDVWMSIYHFPALTAADELGLFNLLEDAPLTSGEVGNRLSINQRGAVSLLSLLSSLGFLKLNDGKYSLTEVSRTYLLPDSIYYWVPMLKLYQDPPVGHKVLMEALLRNRRIDRVRSTEEWAAGELGRERAEELTAAMHSHSFPAAAGLANNGDFKGVRKLLDIGGGTGCFCIALANRYPQMSFTVLELPEVSEFTSEYIAKAKLEDRINVVAADMFHDPWPRAYDAILLSNILHDWDEERCHWLCRRSHEALPAGGSLYVHSMLLSNTMDSPLATAAFSMNMVVRTEGRQFSRQELADLLTACGFINVITEQTFAYYSLTRAIKPSD
jgi:predicted O-methyltransferase YrrM